MGEDGGRFRAGRAVALSWLAVAAGLTVALGPELGWRGWMWLLIHHAICLAGAGHELGWWGRRG